MDCARALQRGEAPAQLAHQDRYTVRSGACVTHKAKDLPAVMLERFWRRDRVRRATGPERGGGVAAFLAIVSQPVARMRAR